MRTIRLENQHTNEILICSMDQVFKNKWRRELKTNFSKMGTAWLNAQLDEWFDYADNRPNADQFIEMCFSSRFGGENAMILTGSDFVIRNIVEILKKSDKSGLIKQALESQGEQISYHFGNVRKCGRVVNLLTGYEIDRVFIDDLQSLHPDDFVQSSLSPNLFLDQETNSFGFYVNCFKPFRSDDPENKELSGLGDDDDPYDWDINPEEHQINIGDFHSGPLQYVSRTDVIFSSVERLIRLCPDRPKHHVRPHDRHLKSGKVTHIGEQWRKNRLKKEIIANEITDHVVYIVKDKNGKVRYIGEGTADRPSHVNSGVSSNYKINEYHFTVSKDLTVETVATNLTKAQAIAKEKLLIKQFAGKDLWNSQHNEPMNKDYRLGITQDALEKLWNE